VCVVSNHVTGIFERWGERLRSERRERRLTQDKVAELAGLDTSTVSRVEAGTAGFAGYVAVAEALDVVLATRAA